MKLIYRMHAVRRMAQRGVTDQEVREVLQHGSVIAEYADDRPYPSRLVLGKPGERPLHVLVADDRAAGETIVITVYEPDPSIWDGSFRKRR